MQLNSLIKAYWSRLIREFTETPISACVQELLHGPTICRGKNKDIKYFNAAKFTVSVPALRTLIKNLLAISTW
jgi:hypothetical protein